MENKDNIIIILDSILDDYYFLWECYSEYKQVVQNEKDSLADFSQSLKEAFELKYFYFYEGVNFDGDEILLTNFILNDLVIEKLLDWENNPEAETEIRIKTSR